MDETIEQHFGTYEQAYEAWRAAHQAACEAEEMVVRCFDGAAPTPPLSDVERARRLRSRAIQMHTAAMALAPDPR
jgi:ferric-dicitrate binding protein FerR (iron transport regulator)